MSFFKENSQKVISLGGIVVSVLIIYFALTYEIKVDTQSETSKHTDKEIESSTLEK
ncbi:MAG: hypothetical protein L3I99_03210 [Sulfurimonas sp.]|nr:hypothetical protein [Sulfurimonas sp.]